MKEDVTFSLLLLRPCYKNSYRTKVYLLVSYYSIAVLSHIEKVVKFFLFTKSRLEMKTRKVVLTPCLINKLLLFRTERICPEGFRL